MYDETPRNPEITIGRRVFALIFQHKAIHHVVRRTELYMSSVAGQVVIHTNTRAQGTGILHLSCGAGGPVASWKLYVSLQGC